CDFNSIHIFRVKGLNHESQEVKRSTIPHFKQKNYTHWIEVDDVFVFQSGHLQNSENTQKNLNNVILLEQKQNLFMSGYKNKHDVEELDNLKWVKKNRSLTYDYFIQSCELKDIVYPYSWSYLSNSAQHLLVLSGLSRNKSIHEKDQLKWNLLKDAFSSFKGALLCELNEIYILPLANAISNFESLYEAWSNTNICSGDNSACFMLEDIIHGKKDQISSLNDFIFFTKNTKSLYFSLKKQFTKKIHIEESLFVENFLGKQELLIDSFHCNQLKEYLELILSISSWIDSVDLEIEKKVGEDLEHSNLKLFHFLNMMSSVNYNDNIFYRLIELKTQKGTIQRSFATEVKHLIGTNLKKVV
ncbi:MAG: hypothetical protein HON90_03140, partial [Halobacteriovoraceae bacterium]|nr:hypothetical protein [Halobacteriovoraceae bacterium]